MEEAMNLARSFEVTLLGTLRCATLSDINGLAHHFKSFIIYRNYQNSSEVSRCLEVDMLLEAP